VCDKLGVTIHYWKGILHKTKLGAQNRGISHQRAMELAKTSDEINGDPMTVIDLLGLSDAPERLVGKVRGGK
jgi:hypothetical protein